MSNYIKFWLRNALYSTAILFFGGTIMQTFLMKQGTGSGEVGIYTTALNAVNVAVSMLFSGIADKQKNIIRAISLDMLPVSLCWFGFIPLCLFFTSSATVTFRVSLVLGVIQSFFIALRTIYEYKLPYRIIPIENYGRLAAADGIISGIFGIVASSLLSYLFLRFEYYTVMLWGFTTAALLTAVSAWINRTMKEIPEKETEITEPAPDRSQLSYIKILLKMPSFVKLIPSNFLRGVSAGVIAMTAVIAIESGKVTESGTAGLVTALFAANLTGSLFFAVFSKRINCRVLCLSGSLVMTVFAFLLAGGELLFIALYFVVCMGKMVFDYAVPTLLYQVVPYEIAGSYHAWRLILTTAGTALASTLTGYLLPYVPAVFLLILAVFCQLYSGWVYFASAPLKKK